MTPLAALASVLAILAVLWAGMTFPLRVQLIWARITRNDILIILTLKELIMADFTKFNASIDRVAAKAAADAAALAAAGAADADVQNQVDLGTAKLDAIAPPEPLVLDQAAADQPVA